MIRFYYPFSKKHKVTFKFGAAPRWFLDRFGAPHNGTDFAADIGTPIYAPRTSTILFVGFDKTGGGNMILLECSGYQVLYLHLSKFSVKVGQKVKAKQLIGFTGATGFVTGPHLHLGIRKKNPKNKWRWLYIDPEPRLVMWRPKATLAKKSKR